MKSSDEIKKGLECCSLSCIGKCPYAGVLDCSDRVTADALALIQQLQAEKAEQAERIQQLEAERDAMKDHLLARGIGLDAENVFHNVLILPCNIGDTIYEVIFTKEGTGSHICERICSGIHITDKVTRWNVDKPTRYFVLKTDGGHSIHVRMDELGKTLFLSREEAEAARRKGSEFDD